jgi:hypothetical protein
LRAKPACCSVRFEGSSALWLTSREALSVTAVAEQPNSAFRAIARRNGQIGTQAFEFLRERLTKLEGQVARGQQLKALGRTAGIWTVTMAGSPAAQPSRRRMNAADEP